MFPMVMVCTAYECNTKLFVIQYFEKKLVHLVYRENQPQLNLKNLKKKIVFENPPDETIKNEDKELISFTSKPENHFIIKKILITMMIV